MVIARYAPAAAATGIVGLVHATKPIGDIARGLAVGMAVLAWLAAALMTRRELRTHASVVLAIGAVTAAGQVDGGKTYGIATAVFLVVSVASMQAVRGAPWIAFRSGRGAALALVVTATVLTGALVVGLPRFARAVEERIHAFFNASFDESTAFSTAMALGATRGMLVSNAVVLRIDTLAFAGGPEGEAPDYLRGAVYDRYQGRYWITSAVGRDRHPVPASAGPKTTRITLVHGAPNGEDMRWFLPPGACGFSTPVDVDGFGVARRGVMPEPPSISFGKGGCPGPIAPTPNDLDLPPDVAASLEPIARSWTRDASTPREKLEALKRELGRFEYSLSVPREPSIDPIVDFLTLHRAGHCELFASAMVLLARTQGIPARVVGGYRVTERNPLTGKIVVRDRNAHAWVEAWVDGAWRAWDPTPASEVFVRRAGILDHLTDVVATAVERITLLDVGLGAGAIGIGFYVVRALRRRASRRSLSGPISRGLPCFERLVDALAGAGHVWDPSEPIELFATRIGRAGADWSRDAAGALVRYAELRYGGEGDVSSVTAFAERVTATIRRS
jgi:hypothetical protein